MSYLWKLRRKIRRDLRSSWGEMRAAWLEWPLLAGMIAAFLIGQGIYELIMMIARM